MAQQPRFRSNIPAPLPQAIRQLGEEIAKLPQWQRERLMPLYERTVDAFRLRTRVMQLAKEALEQAKLEITLLRFDNDVTRKENERLRKELEGQF
jgi:hypothetical protein